MNDNNNTTSLVQILKMRGYDDGWTSGSPSAADKEWFQSRTNVFFQPFGETSSLISFKDYKI